MKTPRSFIVEFKPGRRQPKGRPNSIWGETDFKALAREVKEKAPHLFNSTETSPTPDIGEGSQADPSAGPVARDAGDFDGARRPVASGDSVEAEVSKQHRDNPPAGNAAVDRQGSSEVPPPGTPSRSGISRRRERYTTYISMGVHQDESEQTKPVEHAISLEEVAALDAENKRLKSLLAEQIRAENLELKKMLERFKVT
ncbi:hypothetical protein [Sinorhizobium numidicum]|uniref:hypothetical protein n=1 Tax=Sinorhizobium numidicum TaxID=680248 RepID=UPI003CC8DBDB